MISYNTDMKKFNVSPIGYVKSPYKEQSGTPIQPSFGDPVEAEIRISPEFREGLVDLDRFDRIWLISLLDRSRPYKLKVIPYRDTQERGLFACRAPSRPNPIGISSVRLLSVDVMKGILKVSGIDLLDRTPILDIKPYSPKFDSFPDEPAGWLDKSIDRETADNRFGGED